MAQDPRLVEMVARAICEKLTGLPADYEMMRGSDAPLWQMHVQAAEAAIAVINRTMNP